jgi:hypothetical protein
MDLDIGAVPRNALWVTCCGISFKKLEKRVDLFLNSLPSLHSPFWGFPDLLWKNTWKLFCKYLSLSSQGDTTFRVPSVVSIGAFFALCQCLWKEFVPSLLRGHVASFKAQAHGITVSSFVKGGTGLGSCTSGSFQCFPHCA